MQASSLLGTGSQAIASNCEKGLKLKGRTLAIKAPEGK